MHSLITRLIVIELLLLTNPHAQLQQGQRKYTQRAEIRHVANTATLSANAPRPLAQALIALSEEYGWTIDFEDPPYDSGYDLVDDTAPEWRAAHPNVKGVTAIAGSSFETQFSEKPNATDSLAEEKRILSKVVSDYNESANPGRFTIRDESDGRFAVVAVSVKDENGRDKTISPILDTSISVQSDTQDALTTIRSILDALSAESHANVEPGTMATNALAQSKVTLSGQNIPARVLLSQVLSASKTKLYWHLYYDHDVKSYALNVVPLRRAEYDASGNRRTVLVRRSD